jgi:predicted ribosome quality control (RQC) complex YloA/Tae2 family protein
VPELEAIKRVPASINRYRTILPRRPYVAPPAQDKATPLEADAAFWRPRLAGGVAAGPPAITGALRGMSPLAAREAVFRASGAVDTPAHALDPERLAGAIAELCAPLAPGSRAVWAPSVGLDEAGRVVAFAPYELRHLDHSEQTGSLSLAAERFFGEEARPTPSVQRQQPVQGEIEAARTSEQRKLEALERELANAGAADALRAAGELLLTYSTQVPDKAASIELDGQRIVLDPDKSAVENAQEYFERYTRLRDARRQLPEMIATSKARIAYLDEALVHLGLAAMPEDVAALRSELVEGGYLRGGSTAPTATPGKKGAPKAKAPSPLRLRLGDHTVYVGRTARQNDEATFDLGRPEDIWLHARGVTGAHVILRVDAGKPSEALIRQAAQIAAWHSAARAAASVPVDVTERRHVRKIKGGPPGAVTYSGERTLQVPPRAPEVRR